LLSMVLFSADSIITSINGCSRFTKIAKLPIGPNLFKLEHIPHPAQLPRSEDLGSGGLHRDGQSAVDLVEAGYEFGLVVGRKGLFHSN
jgi:hypothetical protein